MDGLESSRREPPQSYAGPSSSSSSTAGFPPSSSQIDNLPPLTPEDKQKFLTIFNNSQPVNGVINGKYTYQLENTTTCSFAAVVRVASTRIIYEVSTSTRNAESNMVSTQYPTDSPILTLFFRDLADTQRRGALDAQAFTIAMFLIQGCMAGTITSIPPSLPPSLYSEAALTMSKPNFDSLYMTGPSSSAGSGSTWSVPADVKASADAFFDAFDEKRRGFLDREIIQAHLKQTGLPEEIVLQIWWAVICF